MKRFGIWLILVLVSFTFVNACRVISAAEVDYGNIINLTGRQRMLSQKMSKEILLIASNIDVDKNKEELKKTAATFERTLNGLLKGDRELELPPAINQDIANQLDSVQSLWHDFKVFVNETVASAQASPGTIKRVSELNLPLLSACDEVVTMYEMEAERVTGGGAFIINLAGTQRMLTQKMTKEFLLITLNVNADENKLRLERTAYFFERALSSLTEGDKYLKLLPPNKAIIQQLLKVQSLWRDFKEPIDTVISTGKWTQDSIRKIADLSLPVLTETDKIVSMYVVEYHFSLSRERDLWKTY